MTTAPATAAAPAARASAQVLLGTALAVLPLEQMFTDGGWLVDAWLGMAMVVLPAVALRSRRPAAAWHLLPGLAALVVFVTVRFVPHHAIGGLLPGAGTWKDVSNLATLVRTSMTEDVAPLHSTPAIRLFLTFGLAMLAAFVDLFAVGLGRPALAGVPFLLLFTLSGAVPRHPVGWVLVGMGSVGFLLVLSANAGLELSRWGRQAHRGSASVPISTRFGESGRRIGLITVVLTLIVSALVPIPTDDVIADALHHGGNGTAGSGNGGRVFIDPLATLRGELTRTAPVNLFTVSVSRAGQHEPFYARQQILDVYNGSAWVPGTTQASDSLDTLHSDPPVSPFATDYDSFSATIAIQQLAGAAPLFEYPSGFDGLGRGWSWNPRSELVIGPNISSGQRYSEQVVQPEPTETQLRAAGSLAVAEQSERQYLQLVTVPASVRQLVQQLTGSRTTAYDKSRAIFDFFTDPANNFGYSLDTRTGESGSDLVDFLQNRVGFCQQYAAAMGVMLRLANVPSRVVLGFTHPSPDSSGRFQVTTDDAHAWVEAYFAGVGWVPFDPTPLGGADAGRAVALGWAPRSADNSTGGSTVPGARTSAPTAAPRPRDTSNSTSGAASHSNGGDTALTRTSTYLIAGVGFLLILALLPAAVRLSRRRRRLAAGRRGRPGELWAELADTCTDLGIGWSPARTSRQVGTWLREFGMASDGVASLRALATAVELERYGPPRTDAPDPDDELIGEELVHVLRIVRRALIRSATRTRRMRALLLPVSLFGKQTSRASSRRMGQSNGSADEHREAAPS